MGDIGLTYDDFCKLTPEEFTAVWKAYIDRRDADYKDNWMRMRLAATILLQPHMPKGRRLTPEKLIPLPWDNEPKEKAQPAPQMTAEEQRRRMEYLANKFGDRLN